MTTEVAPDASAVAAEPVETPEPSSGIPSRIEDQIGPEPPDEEDEETPEVSAAQALAPMIMPSANVGTKESEADEDDVLDLTSIVPPRKLVRIATKSNPKGEVHQLRLLDDFGIEEQQQLLSWSKRFEALWNKEGKDLTPRERVKMKWLLNAMFFKVLDAPDEIKRDVDDTIKSRVVTAFTMVPLLERQKREQREAEAEEENLPNGDLPTTES